MVTTGRKVTPMPLTPPSYAALVSQRCIYITTSSDYWRRKKVDIPPQCLHPYAAVSRITVTFTSLVTTGGEKVTMPRAPFPSLCHWYPGCNLHLLHQW
ncbi:hypothetical protein AVEN_88095-1 [Araneus ventricosus]|uniref:Uncharacterized protein n=1 Tax=Araneus ventricosus TaxID=182803 RepID=A0A4Y2H232_ARAVE|nr:hypothetical protein AVEN_88095-1 [Araneus ventricosus]